MKKYIGIKTVSAEPSECPKDDQMNKKGDPGYKVEYEGGYVSWSPKDVFEYAYRENGKLTFGMAISSLSTSFDSIVRKSSYGDHVIKRHFPDSQSKMTESYLYCLSGDDYACPWTPTQDDMNAEDWTIVY